VIKIKKKTKLKRFWKEHWDEIILILSVIVGIAMLMKGLGVF